MVLDILRRKFESPVVPPHRVEPKGLGELRLNYLFGLFHPRLHLIAPDWFAAYLRQYQGAYGFTHAENADDPAPPFRTIMVYDERDERAVVAAVRRAHPKRRVWSFTYDVLPRLIARTKHFAHSTPFHSGPLSGIKRYAVVCTPRAGSTFLCDLLWQAGAGRPREHFRYPLVHLVTNTTFNHGLFAARLMRCATYGNVFGTKIITHFLSDAFPKKQDRLVFARAVKDAGVQIIHLRRDKIEQAVSRYIAKNTGTWHVYDDLSTDYRRRLETIPYDFAKLKEMYDGYADEEKTQREFLSVWRDEKILYLEYAELNKDPMSVLDKVEAFTGLPLERNAIDLSTAPVKVSDHIDLHSDFARRFQADLNRRRAS